MCGFEAGRARVQAAITEKQAQLKFSVLDVFESVAGVFGVNSGVFPKEDERLRARDVAYKYGLELLPDWPLRLRELRGYGRP